MAITNLQRKFDKLLFFYLFIRVGNFSNINIQRNDIDSVINSLKTTNCRMVRNINYYSGQIEFVPYQEKCNVYHSYIYHKNGITPDIIKFTGKAIGSSRIGKCITLSNEGML